MIKVRDAFETVFEGWHPKCKLPTLHKICQERRGREISDVVSHLSERLDQSPSFKGVRPGMRVAVAVGSRGISELPEIVRGIVAKLASKGAEPFVVPAMGSHGGGTAEGQAETLRSYGVREDAIGAPVVSSMETVRVGKLRDGTPLYCDRAVCESDGVIVINRVKPHPGFRAEVESGPTKMMLIGLGNREGAAALHEAGFRELGNRLLEGAPVFLENAPVLFGVGIVENSRHRPSLIEVLEPENLLEQEKRLLREARSLMPRIPVERLDVLIVGEMGKDISGAGMDPNVINRGGSPAFEPSAAPRINKIVVLDLTDESKGNAMGLGVADVTTRRLVEKMDPGHTYANALTTTVLAGVKIPMTLPTDREAVAVALRTSTASGNARVAYIRNTQEVDELWVSELCLEEKDRDPRFEVVPGGSPAFDPGGTLVVD